MFYPTGPELIVLYIKDSLKGECVVVSLGVDNNGVCEYVDGLRLFLQTNYRFVYHYLNFVSMDRTANILLVISTKQRLSGTVPMANLATVTGLFSHNLGSRCLSLKSDTLIH